MDPRNMQMNAPMNVNIGGNQMNMSMNLGNNMNTPKDDAMNLIAQSSGCYIKQKVELLEILTGCETKNRYDVALKINNTFYKAFTCKEISNCCCRNFCYSEAREFQMDIKYTPNGVDCGSWALIDRPFKCTCCCFCRPEMTVTLRNGMKIGKINEPWGCCNVNIDITNNQNLLKYKIDRTYCETALLCRNNYCGGMSAIDFPILLVDNSNPNNKIMDGNIERKGRSLLLSMLESDADCFDVVFPKTATPEEKLLIISTVLMLDYRYFEDTDNDNKRNVGGIGIVI